MDFGLSSSELNFFSVFSASFGRYVWPALLVLAVAFILGALLFFMRQLLHRRKILPGMYQRKVFILTVPQRILDKEAPKKTVKEILAGVENLYANFGGLRAQRGFKAWLFGRQDVWSFEIVTGADGLITFYLAVPEYLASHFHQQFLSFYPDCQIEEVDDYNIFNARGAVAVGYLKLVKNKMFPILTFKQMEVDPLLAILSSLVKLPDGHGVAIQLVMRSALGSWRKRGVKIVSEMRQGKNLKQAAAALGRQGGGVIGAMGRSSYNYWFEKEKKDKAGQPPHLYHLSPMEEQMIKAVEEKASKAGMDVNIRLVASAPTASQAKEDLRQITQSFAQYSNYQYANGFKAVIKGAGRKFIYDFIYRNFNPKINCVLNTEEVASLWHLPLPNSDVPGIRWLQAVKLPPPFNLPAEGLILGENLYRGEQALVRMKDDDRRRHAYVIGMTGTGKSWFLANLAIQDIRNGRGVCLIDPHGNLVEDILPYIPKDRIKDVIYFDPADTARPIGLNMLEASNQTEMDFAASEMIMIFYKLLPDPAMAGPMFEHYMRNALLLLMADKKDPGTLVELARVFTDESFRRQKLAHVADLLVKDFWEREYPASQKGSTGADMLSYVISKTGKFVENEMMRNIIGQPKSGINFRQVMDEGKILLLNLSKGKAGEMNSNLLGLIAVSKLQMAALARADMPEKDRRDFYLYIDEFQNFITDSISTILAEARKYRLNLIMAHQYIAQLVQNNDSRVKDAVFGNVGNVISFRIGVNDSEVIAKQLGPEVSEYDLLNIEKFNAYVRLLVDNTATNAFNMHAFPLPEGADTRLSPVVKEYSRTKYGRAREDVMQEIVTRSKIGQLGKKPEATVAGALKTPLFNPSRSTLTPVASGKDVQDFKPSWPKPNTSSAITANRPTPPNLPVTDK